MAALVTLDAFKTHLGITSDADDARDRSILDSVESAVMRSCRRKFSQVARTEYYSGTGGPRLYLRERPLISVAGLWVDSQGYFGGPSGAFGGSNDAWTEGVDFVIERTEETEQNAAALLAINSSGGNGAGFFPQGNGNIKVTYTAGYLPTPADLQLAIFYLAVAVRDAAIEQRVGPVKSETLGRYSYELITGGAAEDATGANLVAARSILAGYREPVL